VLSSGSVAPTYSAQIVITYCRELKIWDLGGFQWHNVHVEFCENWLICSEFQVGKIRTQTHKYRAW
jgi:hypothetical protein